MTVWTIEPRDPLLFRDGRPFNADPGVRAESADFPLPSTIAGAVRTRLLLAQSSALASALPDAEYDRFLGIEIRGPLLAELGEDDGGEIGWMAPAPADAVVVGDKATGVRLRRLNPRDIAPGAASPLAGGVRPATMVTPDKAKPFEAAPRFWHWATYEDWLLQPRDAEGIDPDAYGHAGAVKEQRTHLQVRAGVQTAEEGRLFQTRSLEFNRNKSGGLGSVQRLGLALETTVQFEEGSDVLGGERRLVRWSRRDDETFPACPEAVRREIVAKGGCRLLLLTPAYFDAGWSPSWLLGERQGWPERELQGAAVPRMQVASGWDLRRGQAKESRRLAPAGSVYFLKLTGTPAEINAWIDATWMRSVSDDEQARRDGFGLAALGVWTPLR